MSKYDRVAKEIAGEALNWPPAGPCWSELWEEIRDILKREFPEAEGKSEFLPLPAGFKRNNPLADAVSEFADPPPGYHYYGDDTKEQEGPFNSEKPHTFKEWSDHGYRIKKGEHASGRNEAMERTFKRDQVWKNGDRIVASYSPCGPDDDDFEFDGDDFFDGFDGAN